MTTDEHKKLQAIVNEPAYLIKGLLREFVETCEVVSPTKVTKETRTEQQNKALHKWFEQVAETCRDAGVDAKVIMKSTISVQVNADFIKSLWRVMQEALYNTTSTTKLTKDQQIDTIVDHFVRFFGEKHNIVLPPFPSREPEMSYLPNTKIPYPNDYKKPTIWLELQEPKWLLSNNG